MCVSQIKFWPLHATGQSTSSRTWPLAFQTCEHTRTRSLLTCLLSWRNSPCQPPLCLFGRCCRASESWSFFVCFTGSDKICIWSLIYLLWNELLSISAKNGCTENTWNDDIIELFSSCSHGDLSLTTACISQSLCERLPYFAFDDIWTNRQAAIILTWLSALWLPFFSRI